MSEHKAVPNIRFKGFEDEWEKDSIKNISTMKSGGTPSVNKREYYVGDIPFIRSSDIKKESTELKINNEALKNSSAFMVKKGTVLYALYGATSGQVAISKVTGAINQAVLAIFPDEFVNKYFLLYWLSLNKGKITNKYLQGGQGNLSAKIVKNLLLFFPTKLEQQKIGNLFAKLDKLLDLQQQKIDKLELLKKILLQKLFPKHDADIPELRFKEFNDEWKSMKIGSLFDHKSGTSIEKYFNSDGKYKVISIGSYGKNSKYIDQGIRVNLNSVTKSHLVDKNDLTMVLNDKTPDGQIIGRVLLINKSNEFVINQRTERLIPRNINSKFAFTYLNGPIRKSIKKMVQGGTQIYINYSSIEKIDVLVPKTIEEQQKIGNLLSKVDQLIELENKKLQNFQQVKKCLLQNMFVE